MTWTRRDAVQAVTLAGLAASRATAAEADIRIEREPLFPLSSYLTMQFMEPLGATDGSVAASWDDDHDDWRADFVVAMKDLAPGMIRWGGLYSRYYKWREGVGPPATRRPHRNYDWGGWEMNRVGTAEFVDLCRRVGSEPLMCVNFLSDGQTKYGPARRGDAKEAADWASYASGIRYWQIGNETSYGSGGFTEAESIAYTIEFAKAMRQRNSSIRLIGWGDRHGDGPLWAANLLRQTGELLDFVAIHMMQQHPSRPDSVLNSLRYQQEPEQAWDELQAMLPTVEKRVTELEQVIASERSKAKIAITEGHLSLRPHNANPILAEWLTGVYHARVLNLYARRGDMVKIATAADGNGTRWTVMAVMVPVPRGRSYLLPVGSVMRLFGRYRGENAVRVSGPSDLDITASRTGDRIFLHVANTNYRRAVTATMSVRGAAIHRGILRQIAPENLRITVTQDQPDVFAPLETAFGPGTSVRFPAGSVSVVELETSEENG